MPRDNAGGTSKVIRKHLYLVHFAFGKYAHHEDLFTVVINNNGDLSFTHKGNKLIFFTRIEDKGKVLEAAEFTDPDYSFKGDGVFTVDCAEAIRLVAYSNTDTKSKILNFINTVDDALKTIRLPIPESYSRAIYHLAVHLTFNENFEQILEGGKVTRDEIAKSFEWMVQALVSNMLVIKPTILH